MTRDILTNALLLKVIAGVDGLDDRQIAGTPFPSQVPDYPSLLAAAKTARALLAVAETGTNPFLGEPRKARIGVLREAMTFPELDPRVASLVDEAAQRFKSLGAEIVDISIPGHSTAALIGRIHRLTQSNNLLGRTSGTRQIYQTDLTQKILPWTQEKFNNVCNCPFFVCLPTDRNLKLWFLSSNLLLQGQYCDEHFPYVSGIYHLLYLELRKSTSAPRKDTQSYSEAAF
jgi:amidase